MAARLARLDRRERLALMPSQTPGGLEAVGLTPEDGASAAWAITPDGRRWRGAGAMLVALERAFLPAGWAPLTTLYRLPVVSHLADAAYRLIAASRCRLVGTAVCSIRSPKPLGPETLDRLNARVGVQSPQRPT